MTQVTEGQPGPEARSALAAAELPPTYFELYKLAVEMADRISARRGVANSFFLTVNTGIVTVLGTQDVRWYVPVAGIIFAATWWALLRSYRELNSAKFEIIVAMEAQLPIKVFGDEWARLRRAPAPFAFRLPAIGPWLRQYRELGRVEQLVPWIFTVLYVAELVRQVVS